VNKEHKQRIIIRGFISSDNPTLFEKICLLDKIVQFPNEMSNIQSGELDTFVMFAELLFQ